VVSFDAREPGTSVATWRSDPRWATLPAPRPLDPATVPAVAEPDAPGAFDLVGASGPVVVLAAHADD